MGFLLFFEDCHRVPDWAEMSTFRQLPPPEIGPATRGFGRHGATFQTMAAARRFGGISGSIGRGSSRWSAAAHLSAVGQTSKLRKEPRKFEVFRTQTLRLLSSQVAKSTEGSNQLSKTPDKEDSTRLNTHTFHIFLSCHWASSCMRSDMPPFAWPKVTYSAAIPPRATLGGIPSD